MRRSVPTAERNDLVNSDLLFTVVELGDRLQLYTEFGVGMNYGD